MIYYPKTETEMEQLGADLARTAHGGDIFTLSGDLGAGKTTLSRGFFTALGATQHITSPTFTLMNTYPLTTGDAKTGVHIDTYRLEDEKELFDIGADEYIGDTTCITLIEWPEKLSAILAGKKVHTVTIQHSSDGRIVTVTHG